MAVSLKKLEDQLNCPICLGTYTNPKQLQCNHVYCQQCLVRLIVQDRQGQLTLTCPSCRKITPVPASGVTGLQPAFHINQFLEIVKENKKGMVSTKSTKTPSTALHENINVVCPNHSGKEVDLYCETCGETICWECIMRGSKHHSHEYQKLNQAFEKYKEEISSSLKPLEKKLITIAKTLEIFHLRRDEISDQRKSIEANIHKTITRLQAKLHESLEVRRTELISQLDKLTQAKFKSLAEQRDQIETTQAQLSSCLLFLKENLKTGNQGEALMMKSATIRQVKELTTTFQPDMLEPSTKANIIFLSSADFITDCQNYGKVYADAVVADEHKGDVQTVTFGSQPIHSIQEFIKLSSPIFTIDAVKKPEGVAVNLKGEFVVAERGERQVSVFNASGHKLRSFGQFKTPQGVAVDSNGNILVTNSDSLCIQKFTAEGNLLMAVKASGTFCHHPNGIAISPCNRKVYVGQSGTGRLQVLNSDLSYFSTYAMESKFRPRFIACDGTGNVYVADYGNHRVQVFTTEGKFLRMFGRYGNGRGELNGPCGVAIDFSGKVYVSEAGNHRISQFTSKGQFVTSFGSEGEAPGQFKCPRGLAMDGSGVLYVCDRGNNRVQVFSYTFLHSLTH